MKAEHHLLKSKPIQALVSITGLILLLVWMQGGFTAKTPPGTAQAGERRENAQGPTAKAELKEMDEVLSWPGTVTARSVAQIAPKVSARILEIAVKSGDVVKAGQIVARLDQSELQSRVNQARSMLTAAQAQAAKTGAEMRRVQSLFDQEAATQRTLETAQAASRSAEAQVAEAQAAVAAAQSLLSETVLRAPFDGTVVKRTLEPGDLAMPSAPVLTVQSARHLRVEAAIPEDCARDLRAGQTLKVRIANEEYESKVEEIAPAADPQTRTVLVKAGLQSPAQPGAFAWVDQVCGRRKALLIPSAAVSRTGQLESVRLLEGGVPRLRLVRTGKTHDGRVEILSGLKEGDAVLLGDGK